MEQGSESILNLSCIIQEYSILLDKDKLFSVLTIWHTNGVLNTKEVFAVIDPKDFLKNNIVNMEGKHIKIIQENGDN
jgi:hypothetical protein